MNIETFNRYYNQLREGNPEISPDGVARVAASLVLGDVLKAAFVVSPNVPSALESLAMAFSSGGAMPAALDDLNDSVRTVAENV